MGDGEMTSRVWRSLRQEMIGGNDLAKAEKKWREVGRGTKGCQPQRKRKENSADDLKNKPTMM